MKTESGYDRPPDPDDDSPTLEALIDILFGDQLQSFSIELTNRGLILRGYCNSIRVKWMVEKAIMQIGIQRIAANEIVVN